MKKLCGRAGQSALRLQLWVLTRAALPQRSEAGEGVVSTAIAVLVMAFLGVAMWIAFKSILSGATTNLSHQVNQIGQ